MLLARTVGSNLLNYLQDLRSVENERPTNRRYPGHYVQDHGHHQTRHAPRNQRRTCRLVGIYGDS